MLFLLYWLANALLTSAQLTSDVYEVPLGYPALPLNNMDLSVAKDLRRGAQNDALQRTQSPRPAGKRAHAALPAACFPSLVTFCNIEVYRKTVRLFTINIYMKIICPQFSAL